MFIGPAERTEGAGSTDCVSERSPSGSGGTSEDGSERDTASE